MHVFTSGDEAELFVNGKSQGRKKKAAFEYRLRWDEVVYAPGELRAEAYKDGKRWATATTRTAGAPAKLELAPDRNMIRGDDNDLSFVTARLVDADGRPVPTANDRIRFRVEGPGTLVATDNGDPTDMTPYPSHQRAAFSGLALAIVRAQPGRVGTIVVHADADGLQAARARIVLDAVQDVR